MTLIFLVENVYFCSVHSAVVTRLIAPRVFMSCFLHLRFLKFALNNDLLSVLVTYHFNCLRVYFIPMQVWLFFDSLYTLSATNNYREFLSGLCLAMLFTVFIK